MAKYQRVGACLLMLLLGMSMHAQRVVDLMNNPSVCTIKFADYDFAVVDQYVDQTGVPIYVYGWAASAADDPYPRYARISSQRQDPHAPITMMPPSGASSVRLGTDTYMENGYQTTPAKGGAAGFTYTPTKETALLQVQYAGFVERVTSDHEFYNDPDYWKYGQPYLRLAVNIDGYEEQCTVMEHANCEPATIVGWKDHQSYLSNSGNGGFGARQVHVRYKDWSTMTIDLTPAIGHKVTLVAEYRDCAITHFETGADGGLYPWLCGDHHMSRLYCSLAATAAELYEIEAESGCDPDKVTLQAPDGYASYRWYKRQGMSETSLGTGRKCTYFYSRSGEELDIYCEATPYTDCKPTVFSKHVKNECIHDCVLDVNVPQSVCADAKSFDIEYNYTQGGATACDIIFDNGALAAGFKSIYGMPLSNARGKLNIPMPIVPVITPMYDEAIGTYIDTTYTYVRPGTYYLTLVMKQACEPVENVMVLSFTVLYSSDIIVQKWSDVLLLKNSKYNGGYHFSAIQWYRDGVPVMSLSQHPTYLYLPTGQTEGLSPSGQFTETYWAELTRADDGVTLCTCRKQVENKPDYSTPPMQSSSRIEMAAYGGDARKAQIMTDLSGEYGVYDLSGHLLEQGYFGEDYGSFEIEFPNTGCYIVKLEGNEGTKEVMKWIVR